MVGNVTGGIVSLMIAVLLLWYLPMLIWTPMEIIGNVIVVLKYTITPVLQ